MSSLKPGSKKWISEETTDEEELFVHCREMEVVCYAVTKVILDADNKWKGSEGKHQYHSLANRSYIMELVNIQVSHQNKCNTYCLSITLFNLCQSSF